MAFSDHGIQIIVGGVVTDGQMAEASVGVFDSKWYLEELSGAYLFWRVDVVAAMTPSTCHGGLR